ncbi:TAXI family TRAP transporter solute-binding subunit [Bradyrhizobium sp. SZCCHNPS1003]|uniref:TAXI family TRAP transporter solute-binding subunit n=1 Tax=Bradyrhizobium sp. SZCCHNPS1003 TaxID=3057330 RepID=UPI0028E5C9A3|nr:TAXI family TRAP transporter solute-binding subunit [Bradyrhizobium sp. SZCCHNPS1003]
MRFSKISGTATGFILAAACLLAAPAAQAQSFINVLTGGTSGVYYPLGVAIGKIYGDKIPNVKTQVQATKASVENLILLQQGRGELAFALGDSLKAAWNGEEEAGFKSKLDKLRTIGAIYPNYIQIVATAESGIKTLADLKGKSLSVGAPKSGTELNSRAILAAAGMSYKDLGKVEYLPFAESVDLMKNRQLGATLQSAGLGVASLKDLSTSSPITVVSVPKEVVEKIGAPFVAAIIPANTYTGQDKDVPTAAVINYLVTSSAVSDDLAYQMTKLIFDSLPELANAHAAGKEIKLETAAQDSPVPLHPGAIRYYKEKGILK